MWSWVSLTMTLLFICLTLTLNNVIEANEFKLIGSVYCDTCFRQRFSRSSHFIAGALVAVECGDETRGMDGKPIFRQEVKTDVKGEFRVILPSAATKHVHEIKWCSVKLISSSKPDCAVAAISTATTSSIRVKIKNHVFSDGFFTSQPLEQPKRCQWESHANSNDEISVSTPLPSPVVDGMLSPISSITNQNTIGIELHDYESNFEPLLPLNQPPPNSMFIPKVPPPPNSMANTGFQPPPDSMLNTGYQSPPDSMLNTGFQPPPADSMFNIGLQSPPPDSMFNLNPLQPPPDSITNPSPPSLFPQLLTPPPPSTSLSPSLTFPPLDPQPDLIQAAPPPPFNPPFPAFPFQPSAGLPRMPPETKKPPLLYK